MSGDIHGRNRIVGSVLTNWVAQLFHIASGFIVPRLIDRNLGTESLGIWDFSWSIVVYFNLINLGATSSINRYVAYHRSRNDLVAVNEGVSSIAMVMRAMALIVLAISAVTAWQLENLFAGRLQEHLGEARWLIFILGSGIAMQLAATVYSSILTGCHRWDWHNGIQTAINILMLVSMAAVLMFDGGLIGLAITHLVAETIGRLARAVVAHRICPWLKISPQLFRQRTAAAMLRFGGKTFVTDVSQMLMNATISVLVASHLGPAALAIYTRPISLMRNAGVFIHKYATVFSPTISSLQGAGDHQGAVSIALKATKYGIYIALPLITLLVTFGGEVMRFWMGGHYAQPLLVAIVSLGFAGQLAHIPLFKALIGFGFHGQPGIVNLIAALLALGASFIALSMFSAGIVTVGTIVAVAMLSVHMVYLPFYACRRFGIPSRRFYREVWKEPLITTWPYVVLLAIGRLVREPLGGWATLIAALAGCLLLAISYWRRVVPLRIKEQLLRTLRAKARIAGFLPPKPAPRTD
jgi:O-antigen/teichoic acid export membrane protein